jgi:dihydrofolate reductase
MRKVILFMHTSLDGFVSGLNGEMDWIKVDDELFEFSGKFIDNADTALYGRVTYQMMQSYWPTAADKPNASNHDVQHSRWYKSVNKIVVSKTFYGRKIENTKIISENLFEEILKIKQLNGKDILIFGSPGASHSLMQLNLIDEYWLFVNPILLGVGIPLFKNIPGKVNLKLIQSITFLSGVLGIHYKIQSA